MAEEVRDDNASKLVNAAAREMVRVVKHPATDEYLILLDTSVVPDNAVLVNVSKWGTPLEKGAKAADKVPDDKIFVCKPVKLRNPERRQPAQPRYSLVKRHNGRFYPAETAAAPKTTSVAAEPKTKRAKKDAPATATATQEKKKKKKPAAAKAREEPSRKLLEDALKAIKEYTKHAK